MAISPATCLEQNSACTVLSVAIFNFLADFSSLLHAPLAGLFCKSKSVECFTSKSKSQHTPFATGLNPNHFLMQFIRAGRMQFSYKCCVSGGQHRTEISSTGIRRWSYTLISCPFPLQSLFLFWCKYFKTKQEKKKIFVPLPLQNVPLELSANPIR